VDLTEGACRTAGYARLAAGCRDQRDAAGVLRELCAQCPVRRSCLRTGRRTHTSGLAGGVVLLGGVVAPGGTAGNPARMTDEPEYVAPVTGPARHSSADLAERRGKVRAARLAGLSGPATSTALGLDASTVGNDLAWLRRAGHVLPASGTTSTASVEPTTNQAPAAGAQHPVLVGPEAPAAPARPARPRRKLTRAQRRRQRGTYWRARRQRARRGGSHMKVGAFSVGVDTHTHPVRDCCHFRVAWDLLGSGANAQDRHGRNAVLEWARDQLAALATDGHARRRSPHRHSRERSFSASVTSRQPSQELLRLARRSGDASVASTGGPGGNGRGGRWQSPDPTYSPLLHLAGSGAPSLSSMIWRCLPIKSASERSPALS